MSEEELRRDYPSAMPENAVFLHAGEWADWSWSCGAVAYQSDGVYYLREGESLNSLGNPEAYDQDLLLDYLLQLEVSDGY